MRRTASRTTSTSSRSRPSGADSPDRILLEPFRQVTTHRSDDRIRGTGEGAPAAGLSAPSPQLPATGHLGRGASRAQLGGEPRRAGDRRDPPVAGRARRQSLSIVAPDGARAYHLAPEAFDPSPVVWPAFLSPTYV